MKTLVTGGAGFIGSHIVDRLVELGHDVIAVDDLSTGSRENVHARARFHQIELSDPELARLVAIERPVVILHQAAQVDVRKSQANPLDDIRTNVVGTLALAIAAVAAGARRFIFASSGGAIYGEDSAYPTPENDKVDPVSPYGCSKLAAEKYLATLTRTSSLEVMCLRYANVYGPRQSLKGEAGVVSIFARKFLAGEVPTIFGDGEQTRDFVYVKDVVAANVLAITSEKLGVYNIGTGRETTVNQLYRILARLTGVSADEKHGPPIPGEQKRSVLSSALAARELGWKPVISLEDGLKETVEYFRGRSG